MTGEVGSPNYKRVEDAKVETSSAKIDSTIEKARNQDPVEARWGFYFQPRQKEAEEGFLWFESWVKVLRFLRRDLLVLMRHDDNERQGEVQKIVDDLIECRINKAEARAYLNEVLKPAGQILWWGGLSELATGDDDFAHRVRSHFNGGPSSHLREEQLPELAASLQGFSLSD